MSTDTKDAPTKAPAKGFSLRSRLLGIPAEEAPASPKDDSVSHDAESVASGHDEALTAERAGDTENHDSHSNENQTDAAASDQDEEPEAPRVGVAVNPKRSLLAMAFGLGDKKKKERNLPPSALNEGARSPAPQMRDDGAAIAPLADTQDSPKADEQLRAAETLAVAAPRAEPLRERIFSMFRSEQKHSSHSEETEALDVAAAREQVESEPQALEQTQPGELEVETPNPIEAETEPATPVPFVRFDGVMKTYDGVNVVVKDLNLDIAKGEFLTLLGPSGSGKTTTLMMLAGFEQPTAGDIMLNGSSMMDLPPHKRGLGFVFQNYALFPHMSVSENVAFPLEVRRTRGGELKERVARALGMVELTGFEKRKPHQLSGGQQQRVAMARALVFDPQLVLMDEPLGALDKHLREQMQYELKRLHRELGVTVVYVTHDQGEALTLSDRIAVFHNGIIQQLDTPTRIYDEPANAFVAGFIGENNALPGKIVAIKESECVIDLIGGARVRAMNGNCETIGQEGVVCVRPEYLTISAETTPGGNHVAALIEDFIFHGDHVRVKLSAPGMGEIVVKAPARGSRFPAKGVAVTLCWEPHAARAFIS